MRETALHSWPPRLPKLCGGDIELGNFILGASRPGGTGYEASRALLRQIDGWARPQSYFSSNWSAAHAREGGSSGCSPGGWCYASKSAEASHYDAQDWGRKFLPGNGGCVYIDLDHLEVCLPEVISAWDHVAAWHAMLRIARAALESANRQQPPGEKIQVLVNNSDGQNNSYGAHLDFLVTRRAWENLFERRLHTLLFLAAFQVSSIVFTGQGKVGAENGAPAAGFQISQRADFFETLTGLQTTYRRPIVNSRDEPLCGRGNGERADAARLHVIFFDSTLAHVACLLKVGVMQIVLAMIEAGCTPPGLILEDPLEAVVRFSHDPTLTARARTVGGEELTAVELQLRFLEEAGKFVEAGGCEGAVPRAPEILALWEDTLAKLEGGDLGALASRLDWVLKLCLLQRVMDRWPGLDWNAPQVKHLDHLYASLDASEGLYWTYERNGLIQRVVSEADIERFLVNPPEDTRAWTRAMLLRRARAGDFAIDDVDWDSIRFRLRGRGYWPTYRTLSLGDPLAFTKASSEPCFRQVSNLEQILDALEAVPPNRLDEPERAAWRRCLPG